MPFNKKNKLGFAPSQKPRTSEEISKEYSGHATQYGHTLMQIEHLENALILQKNTLQQQAERHLAEMRRLSKEADAAAALAKHDTAQQATPATQPEATV